MKYLLASFIIVASMAQAIAQTSTTKEEYEYLTQEYRKEVSEGAEPKEGYYFEDLKLEKQYRYKYTAKKLIRKKKKEVAAISIVIHSQLSGNDYYLCVPLNNLHLRDEYYESIKNLDQHLVQALALFVSDVLIEQVN